MPLATLARRRFLVYAHSTASADGYADESYTLVPSDADDGAYPMNVGTPSASMVLVAQQAETKVTAVLGCGFGVPVSEGDVVLELPTGEAFKVVGVTDAHRTRRRLLNVVAAGDAVYELLDSTTMTYPLPFGVLLGDGNSLWAGSAVDPRTETVQRYVEASYPGVRSLNFAIGGGTTTQTGVNQYYMGFDAAAQIDASYRPDAGLNILCVWEGRNEITTTLVSGGTITARQVADRLEAYCRARRAAGFKVILLPIPPTTQPGVDDATYETIRTGANALLAAERATYCDEFLTLPDEIMAQGAESNRTWYVDNFHPSAAANEQLIAPAVAAAIERIRNTPPRPITRVVVTPAAPTIGLATPAVPRIARVVVTPTDPTLLIAA